MSNKTAVLEAVVTGGLPAGSPVNLAAAAPFDLNGTTQSIAALADISGTGGSFTNSASVSARLTINTASTNVFSGVVRDVSTASAIHLVKSGNSTQTLNGANSYHGNTTITGGTLAFGQATLPTSDSIRIATGAVLNLNFAGTNQVVGLLLSALVARNPTNISYAIKVSTLLE